ncbi:MAG TPA: hypothetical protein PLR20_01890 [Syntrophales bacterium]|nr:hypothetical protein [Syntrophales bacterium]HPI57222.1 hypothetical protein [Syntrophales bacterium]HPN23394.1 hypothetical protein [Syntrophales bacterium]HQM28081.1 hypothetical protein [Syntrophales bacterium]
MGFLLLFIVPLYIIIAVIVSRRTWKKTEKKSTKYWTIAFFILFPTCDTFVALIVMGLLCVTHGGEHIYQTVRDVDGYFDLSIYHDPIGWPEALLIKKNFKFIEMDVKKVGERTLTTEPGLYRFYRAEKGNPLCKRYYEVRDLTNKHRKDKLPDEICVAVENIPQIGSRYSYRHYEMERYFIGFLKIAKAETRVTDFTTGKVIGRANSYLWYGPWWNLEDDLVYKCPRESRDMPSIHITLLEKVLIPYKTSAGGEK